MTDPINPAPAPEPQPAGGQTPPPGGVATATGAVGVPMEPTKDEKTMAMLAHLLGLLSVLGPLIIWLIKKDESKFVDDQGKESLNFQITALFVWVGLFILAAVTCGAGGLLFPVFLVLVLVFCIMAALKANEGVAYRYPICIRLIK